MKLALCFPGLSPDEVERVEFYRSDRDILSRLGDTSVAYSARQVPSHAELVFSWWWDRSFPTVLAGRLRRVPIVVTGACDIGNPVGLPPSRWAVKNVAARATGSFVSTSLALSRAEAARLSTWRYPRVRVVPAAVDTAFYDPPEDNHRDRFMLLTILQLNRRSMERKGLLRAIEALALGADRRFRLVVTGEDQGGAAFAAAHAARLGVADRVAFTGRVPRLEKRRLLWEAGAYLQISSYEGFGYAVAEAMAAGCPIVTSTAGALPEVTDGRGYGYADSAAELAGVLARAASDHEGLCTAASACLSHCQSELDYATREVRLRAIFESLLG